MAEIYSLRPSEHEAVQQLLPWHVTGTLSAQEAARVESHLGECAECRDDLVAERSLARDVALLPLDVEDGWSGMATRMGAAHKTADRFGWLPRWRDVPTAWAMSGAIAASLVVAVVVSEPRRSSAPEQTFHTLGSPAAAASGQAIVLFRPDTSAQQIGAILSAQGAKVIDGPTTAGAYVLRFDHNAASAIEALRRSNQVVLAEPLASDGRP
jgi:hypothetical protein